MLRIEDQTAVTAIGKFSVRTETAITKLVIHRTLGTTGREMAKEFEDTRKFMGGWYTGGKTPYHFFVRADGTIDQCLPLLWVGPAALPRLNRCGIHIALGGNFSKESPTALQMSATIDLCVLLQNVFKDELEIRGHTEYPGASSDPEKACPGAHLDMENLRMVVTQKLAMLDAGILRWR